MSYHCNYHLPFAPYFLSYVFYSSRLRFTFVCWACLCVSIQAQESNDNILGFLKRGKPDTLKAFRLLTAGKQALAAGRYDSAQLYLLEANIRYFQESNRLGFKPVGRIDALRFPMQGQLPPRLPPPAACYERAQQALLAAGRAALKQNKSDTARNRADRVQFALESVFGRFHPDVCRAYQLEADALAAKSRWSQAVEYYQQAGSLARVVLGDRSIENAEALEGEAKCEFNNANFARAREQLQAALRIRVAKQANKPENQLATAQTRLLLGQVLLRQDNFTEALEQFRQVQATFKRVGTLQSPEFVDLCRNLGVAMAGLGDYAQAALQLEQALKIEKQLGKKKADPLLLLELGTICNAGGDYPQALHYLEQARTEILNQPAPDRLVLAGIYFQLGVAYRTAGEPEPAIQNLNKGYELYRELLGTRHTKVAEAAGRLAEAYEFIGKYTEALSFYQSELTTLEALSSGERPHAGLSDCLLRLGKAHIRTGKTAEAISILQKSLTLLEKAGNGQSPAAAPVLSAIAQAYEARREFSSAMDYYKKALTLREKAFGTKHPEVAQSHFEIGKLNYRQVHYAVASGCYQKAICALLPQFNNLDYFALPPMPQPVLSYPLLIELLIQNGTTIHRLCKLEKRYRPKALLTFRLAAELAEKYWPSVFSQTDRDSLLCQAGRLYENAIEALLQPYDAAPKADEIAEALNYAERDKILDLVHAIAAARPTRFPGLPDSLFAQQQQLHLQLDGLRYSLQRLPALSGARGQAITEMQEKLWRNQLMRTEQQLDSLQQVLKVRAPQYARLITPQPTQHIAARLKEWLSRYAKPTAVIEYVIGPQGGIYIFFITARQIQAFAAKDADLVAQIKSFRKSIELQDNSSIRILNAALYRALIKPIENSISNFDLIIIPDRMLHELPFEALTNSSGSYLGENRSISYALTATDLLNNDQQPLNTTGLLLALAPDYGESGLLPSAREEVNELAQLFTDKRRIAKVLVADSATEKKLILYGAKAQFIHLAARSWAHDNQPERSGIYLPLKADFQPVGSPPPPVGADGILSVGEFYGLGLSATVITLSSCQTDGGGEGFITLLAALKSSSTRIALITRWRTGEAATGELIRVFYTHLLDGLSPAEALRAARQQLRKKAAFSHPVHWSNWHLVEF
jgi:CHAT domain-containing protein